MVIKVTYSSLLSLLSISVIKATSSRNCDNDSLGDNQLNSEATVINSSIFSSFEILSSLDNHSQIYSSYFTNDIIFFINSATSISFEYFTRVSTIL